MPPCRPVWSGPVRTSLPWVIALKFPTAPVGTFMMIFWNSSPQVILMQKLTLFAILAKKVSKGLPFFDTLKSVENLAFLVILAQAWSGLFYQKFKLSTLLRWFCGTKKNQLTHQISRPTGAKWGLVWVSGIKYQISLRKIWPILDQFPVGIDQKVKFRRNLTNQPKFREAKFGHFLRKWPKGRSFSFIPNFAFGRKNFCPKTFVLGMNFTEGEIHRSLKQFRFAKLLSPFGGLVVGSHDLLSRKPGLHWSISRS